MGYDVRDYAEEFYEQFLRGKIRFETEVLNIRKGDNGRGWSIRRGDNGRGWSILVRDRKGTNAEADRVLYYTRIVVCTGVSCIRAALWAPKSISPAYSSGAQ